MNAIRSPSSSDATAVTAAAEGLGISEFDFFRVAYRRWCGREPDETKLEKIFVAYIFHRSTPHWVRHLSREVLQRRRAGRLDPEAFGVAGFTRRMPMPRLGRFSWQMMALMLVIVFLMSLETTYVKDRTIPAGCPGTSGSIFLDRFAGWIFKDDDVVCPPFTYPGRRKMFTSK
jgi:hypothetical protein